MKKLSKERLKRFIREEMGLQKNPTHDFWRQDREGTLHVLKRISGNPKVPSEVRNSASILMAYFDRGMVGKLEEQPRDGDESVQGVFWGGAPRGSSKPENSHEANFFMGSIDVSSGLKSMIEGLREIDDPKIQNSFRRLLVEMQTKVKSISDAYTKVIGQQAESGRRE